ncbi:hypothetical protein F0919_15680 [Taibaiella lutea]|uniref:Pentapeptide MXKDX repeat protein n=1 Tax=Taibaiella lutea TaxID=2608001 RepID=A0A5M6CAP1_9BACT|nr:hypothetical protein [Taibaiella lutea]KAA5532238.1 hypothetical protein F0919_15680 [Taibaiella lutea]
MKRIFLMLCGCMLFTSLSFAQQDSTGMNGKNKSAKKHNSSTSTQNDTSKKDSSKKMKRNDKKGGMNNNLDSTATMER